MPEIRKRIDLSDRETISIGIMNGQPLKKIGALIGKHVSSITNEIKKYRIFIRGSYYAGNDCKYACGCDKRHVCGDDECAMFCYSCPKNCHNFCSEYYTEKCTLYERPPYVCNACKNRRRCQDDMYLYDARVANRAAVERRSESRKGIHLTDEELSSLNMLLSTSIKKGQPISHIFAEHEDEIPVTSRTAYTYINNGLLDVRNIDLRRQASYKKRRKKSDNGILDQNYRQGRTYADFQKYMEGKSDSRVFEMDTVHGKRGGVKTLLTILFRRNSVMLILLMPDCTAESVIYWFNYLEISLGTDAYYLIFDRIQTP